MMYVEIMKNFLLADSSELMAVRLIFASWAKNKWSYFVDMIYVEFMKNFLLADSSGVLAITLILASWPKNVWFLLSAYHVRRVLEKVSSRRFERADGC